MNRIETQFDAAPEKFSDHIMWPNKKFYDVN